MRYYQEEETSLKHCKGRNYYNPSKNTTKKAIMINKIAKSNSRDKFDSQNIRGCDIITEPFVIVTRNRSKFRICDISLFEIEKYKQGYFQIDVISVEASEDINFDNVTNRNRDFIMPIIYEGEGHNSRYKEYENNKKYFVNNFNRKKRYKIQK